MPTSERCSSNLPDSTLPIQDVIDQLEKVAPTTENDAYVLQLRIIQFPKV